MIRDCFLEMDLGILRSSCGSRKNEEALPFARTGDITSRISRRLGPQGTPDSTRGCFYCPSHMNAPNCYVEWFSLRKNHYRFELNPGEAWIVPDAERGAIDQESRRIREALADQMSEGTGSRKESDGT